MELFYLFQYDCTDGCTEKSIYAFICEEIKNWGLNKGGDILTEKPTNSEKRKDIRIPIIAVQGAALFLCFIIAIAIGSFLHYRQTTQSAANADNVALGVMQQTNDAQTNEIEKLARTTASLQADLERLNSLDVEIRRIVNNEDTTTTSRAGLVRPVANYKGQGGPVRADLTNVTDINALANNLKSEVQIREQSLGELKQEVLARQIRLAANPSIWPTSGDVSSRFGSRNSPWGEGSDWHPGIDIANNMGTPIFATADGVVVQSGWSGGYGNLVQINHGNGISTLYGHNSQIAVSVGETVKKGQIISYMGSTGNSTGPHCHYEVRVNGTVVNPESFLLLN